MQTFLSNVIDDIISQEKNISELTFILPSKRAGVFLKNEIKNKLNHTFIFPKIISIEDFIDELSSLQLIDNTTLLFKFYSIYLNHTNEKLVESFDTFTKWATIALQDFNEIDRHLVDSKYLFSYLKDINQLEKWSLEKNEETPLIKNYFNFFERLETYYSALNKNLLGTQQGYQGLQYRESIENLQNYIENNKDSKLVFIGFNALNKAEEIIIQELLENEIAKIYWDVDQYYFNNNQASVFLKRYKNTWKYYEKNPFNWIKENFSETKQIQIIGTPKNNSQLKYVGELLTQKENDNFQNTALVLADESLLPLALNSLPQEVSDINITMGYDLKNVPISQLFSSLLKLHMNSKKNELTYLFYYKDVLKVLNQPSIKGIVSVDTVIAEILKNNYIFLDATILEKLTTQKDKILSILFLFSNWNDNANIALSNCLDLIEHLIEHTNTTLEKEYLFKLKSVFQQLESLNSQYGYIKNIKTLQAFYNQLLSFEKLSFKGEPLSGLQLMGMLETRVLDFETVILTSANEGILPAGKSENSFIPFDVKKDPKVNLPTYQEKDAIFSYHFYRLLQRAKNVYLLYNTENDQYGSGEQSRFITQLEINFPISINRTIVSPKLINSKSELKIVHKNAVILEELINIGQKGFSPTSLTTYIYNPIKFYDQKILGVKESDDIEETVAANTLGTIIHKTLEALYLPIKGQFLQKSDIMSMQNKVPLEVEKWFKNEYTNGDITSGKNLLIYNVAQQFIQNFLKEELQMLDQGKQLKILELEHELNASIQIEGIDFPIKLKGEADRIDELDGVIRIVDYKTGKVEQKDLNFKDWQLISTDYNKGSKPFQVLLYAYMYAEMNELGFENCSIESGIVSFKNLKAGFMKVNKKVVDEDDMNNFLTELKTVLLEIFNAEIPFVEKENLPF